MNEYHLNSIERWRKEWEGKLVRTFLGGERNKQYYVATVDKSPLPTLDDIVMCFADNWWPFNFGGFVERDVNGYEARVTVYID